MNKKILVIDDDEDIRAILAIIFCDEGYNPILFDRGIDPEQIKKLLPDLIVLDIRIAGYEKSGNEICEEIKSHTELTDIPVLLISAEDNIYDLA